MEEWTKTFLSLNVEKNIDYYEYYKSKFIKEDSAEKSEVNKEKLKNKLIEFRKIRAKELNIPAYFVFTNDELELLLEEQPHTIEELKNSKILTPVKIKTHGELIINIINERSN